MKQRIRTFVAVEISPAVRQAAAEVVGELATGAADVKWVEPENLHLTLKFLGDVNSREIPDVCRKVQQAAAPRQPFPLVVRGAGAFPSVARPRTIWLGVKEGSDEITTLTERLESALAELGFGRESRRFHPHLTLGRVRRGGPGLAALSENLQALAEWEVGRFAVDQLVVFSSQLSRSGPIHEALARAPLGGR